VVVMGEFDTQTWIEAARFVARLRCRIWRCQLGLLAAFLFQVPVLAFWEKLNPYVRGILFSLYPLALCACCLIGSVAFIRLGGFRCLRCGERFFSMFWTG
jgi:hypothetical protein